MRYHANVHRMTSLFNMNVAKRFHSTLFTRGKRINVRDRIRLLAKLCLRKEIATVVVRRNR